MTSTALITGASGGIGLALAKEFARHRHNLVLVARSEERLHSIALELREQYSIQVAVIAQDLSQSQAGRAVFEQVRALSLTVDILVNNAGFGDYSPFIEEREQSLLEMIQLNVSALTHLTHLFLPGMVERGRGGILNVASTAAFEPGPYMAVYFATKAYVLILTESLQAELARTGLHVTTLCPGPTGTDFEKRATEFGVPLFAGKVMKAADVARIGYDGFMKGKVVVIPGLKNKLLVFLVRCTPRRVVRRAMRSIMKP